MGLDTLAPSLKKRLNQTWIVIPAFREAQVIREVVMASKKVFRNVVVIDDGSPDETANRAAEAGAAVIRHPINLGQGAALQTGITFALQRGARFIATFDADGQHRIEDIPAMIDLLEPGEMDVVLGSRFKGNTVGMSAGRKLLLRAAVLFTRLTTGLALTDTHNGLRALTREAAQRIRLRQNRMAHASEFLAQVASNRLKYTEIGNTILYTEHSMAKGQRASNALNIFLDLLAQRLHK